MDLLQQYAVRAKAAASDLALYAAEHKNKGLAAIADALEQHDEEILAANHLDLSAAQKNKVRPAMLDRLALSKERIQAIAKGVRDVMALPDPIGEIIETIDRPNGLKIQKVRVPLGVIGIIYEARPNVTVDAAVLCLKAGNAAFLRGGKEALHTNIALAKIMRMALEQAGLNPDCIQLLEDTTHKTAQKMMRLRGGIDVLIPRGGAGLIRSVLDNASIPVIETGVGNCHLYVDRKADLQMAVNLLYDGKCTRPSVCNALETLLVHQEIADAFLPMAKQRLDTAHVEWRGCAKTCKILPAIQAASEKDYEEEYNDYILAVKVVESLTEAISHIQRYSTHHSECIVTEDAEAARRFMQEIDAAAVYVNASTRFTDGGEFGLGAEIGISTQKMHARGPMGLREMTSYKYLVFGEGQSRG